MPRFQAPPPLRGFRGSEVSEVIWTLKLIGTVTELGRWRVPRDTVALSVASKPIFTFRFRVPRFKVPRFQVPQWGREIVEVQGSEVPGSAAGAVRLWEVPRFQGSRFHVSGGSMRGVN